MTFCARDPDNKNFLLDPDPTFECTSPEFPTPDINVTDPGCLSRIRILTFYPSQIPDLGSRIRIRNSGQISWFQTHLGGIVDIRAALEQHRGNVLVAVVGGDVEGREPALARHVGVVVVLQQQCCRLRRKGELEISAAGPKIFLLAPRPHGAANPNFGSGSSSGSR